MAVVAAVAAVAVATRLFSGVSGFIVAQPALAMLDFSGILTQLARHTSLSSCGIQSEALRRSEGSVQILGPVTRLPNPAAIPARSLKKLTITVMYYN
jgi:hypothetical protein